MPPDEDEQTTPAEASEQAGVFGNLPKTRPGARSPRRDAQARPRAAPKQATAKPSGRAAPPPPRAPRAADRPADPAPAGKEGGGGLEDVAWAGVAAAAEAATIGVRLATRALESMRDAVDRR